MLAGRQTFPLTVGAIQFISYWNDEKEESVDAIEAILTRRSIRRYTPQQVSEETVRQLLQAAMSAPSAGNEQPWQFVVITERRLLDEIPRFHPFAAMLKEASVAIVVCGDLRLEKNKGYWVQDCSAATQNLLLAAHAKGLGAVWLGVYPREDRVVNVRKLLGLPESVVPLCLVPLGYPAERIPSTERYDPSRAHVNTW
jgi:nitroreductase